MGFDTTWKIINLSKLKENSTSLETLKDFFSTIRQLEKKADVVKPINLFGRNDLGFWLGFSDWKYQSKIHNEWKKNYTYEKQNGTQILKKYKLHDKKVSIALGNQIDTVLRQVTKDTDHLINSIMKKSQLKLKRDGYYPHSVILLSDNRLLALKILAKMAILEHENKDKNDLVIFQNSFLKYVEEEIMLENLKIIAELSINKGDCFISQTI